MKFCVRFLTFANESQLMDEREIRKLIKDEFDQRDLKERQEIIDCEGFKVMKGDIASTYESCSNHQFPWDSPFVSGEIEDRLYKLIKRGLYKEHPGWARERATLIQITKINTD